MTEATGGDLGYWVETTPRALFEEAFSRIDGLRDDIFSGYRSYETVFDSLGSRRFLDFLVDPLPFLATPQGQTVQSTVAGETREWDPLPIEEVAEAPQHPWKIRTTITNHHIPLNPRPVIGQVMLNLDDKTIDLTITKFEA
jgi:hypothetical protein